MRFLFASAAPLVLGWLLAAPLASLAQTTSRTTTTTKKTTVKKPVAKKPAARPAAKPAAKPAAAATPAPAPVAAPAPKPLTAEEANQGIKEALTQGVTRAVQFASEPDGFNLNDDIRIPFPPDAQLVAATISRIPGLGQPAIDNVTNLLNRAAEAAAPQAKDIFLSAVQNLTINDALTLVTSRQTDAATQVLRRTTEAQLQAACKPIIEQQLSQVGATKAYANLINRYNKIPLMTPASTNLTDYVTQQTVEGLFVLLAQQEAKIRKNPAAQASAILQRVFGAAK